MVTDRQSRLEEALKIKNEALESALQRESVIRQIIQTVHSSFDLEETFQQLANALGEFLQADRCFISRYDDLKSILYPPTLEYRSSEAIESMINSTSDLWAALCKFAHQLCVSQQPIDFTHETYGVSSEVQTVLKHFQVQSGIGCAVVYRQTCLAVVFVHQVHHLRIWTEDEKKIIEAIARQSAVAIYQSDLYKQEQDAKQEAQAARELAEIANQKKSQFLSTISHELRTPLNAIIGFSDMFKEGYAGPLNEKQQRYIHNIVTNSHHLLALVNNLLDVANVDYGDLRLRLESVALEPFLKGLAGECKSLAASKKVALTFDIQPGLGQIEADPARLHKIFMNLIHNAIKFNRENGEVLVQVAKSEDQQWLVCEIKDTGIGIPADKMNELFSTFFQVDNSYSRSFEGTGLGLALTKRLVDLHGGAISAESEENRGSKFIVRLPLQSLVKHGGG